MIEEKEHQWHDGFPRIPNLTIIPWIVWALIWVFVIGALYAGKVFAEPIAQATVNEGKVVITVYTEPCSRQDVVTNLPKRSTWVEGGKTYEGCVGVQPEAGVAMFWFDDKTVAIVPLQLFARVTGV